MWRIFGSRSEYRAAPRVVAEEQRIRWQAERQADYDNNKDNPPPSVPTK